MCAGDYVTPIHVQDFRGEFGMYSSRANRTDESALLAAPAVTFYGAPRGQSQRGSSLRTSSRIEKSTISAGETIFPDALGLRFATWSMDAFRPSREIEPS